MRSVLQTTNCSQFVTILIFIFALLIRMHYISEKSFFHIDEIFSMTLCTNSGYAHDVEYDSSLDKTYTGKKLKELSFFKTDSITAAFDDIKNLYCNPRDGMNSNLYYTILRLWFAGKSTIDLDEIKMRACYLNLIFFIISFILMWKFLNFLSFNPILVNLGLALTFLNAGSISNSVFMRQYQIQEMCFIALGFVFLYYLDKIRGKQELIENRYYYTAIFVISLTLLAGYFGIIYLGFLALVIFIECYTHYREKIVFFLKMGIYSIVVTLLLFPKYFIFLDVINKKLKKMQFCEPAVALCVENKIYYTINMILVDVKKFYDQISIFIYPHMIVVLLIMMLCAKSKKLRTCKYDKICVLIIFTALWAIIVSQIVPWNADRYITAAFSIILLLVPVLLGFYSHKIQVIISSLIISIYVIMAFDQSKIKYISDDGVCLDVYEKTHIPVVVIGAPLITSFMLPYIKDKQIYSFANNVEVLKRKIQQYDHLFIICDTCNIPMEDYCKDINYLVIKKYNNVSLCKVIGNCHPYCYEIKKNSSASL